MEKRKSNTVELPLSPICSEGMSNGAKLNEEQTDGRSAVLPIPDYERSSTSSQPYPPLYGQQAGMSPFGYNQTGMPAGGYNQTGMPAGGYNQAGVPAGGYTQAGMPTGGYNQAGMPAGGYYPQPPFYPQGYFPPPNNNNMPQQQQQQQQTTNVSVVVGQPQPAISFRGPITLACVTFWCFNPLFGLVAFILAMVGKSEADGGNVETARRLTHASVGVSISGKIIGLLAVGLALGLVFGVYRSYNWYVPSSHCSSLCSYGSYNSDCNVCCSSYNCDNVYYTYSYTDGNGCRHCTYNYG